MEINVGHTEKLSMTSYLPAEEALVPKKCRFCFQLMEIKQINLTEAVRQCYKCSTPLQQLNVNDIDFFHRSYRDINKHPADWSLNVSSEKEELNVLQSWMEHYTLSVTKYDDSSDDDVSDQSNKRVCKQVPGESISQADDTGVNDLVKVLEESVDCPTTQGQCEWNTTAMDELEAALERASNEKPNSDSLPFSFDEFFLPTPAIPKTAPDTAVTPEDSSRSHHDAPDKILQNSLADATFSAELDVQSAAPGPTGQLKEIVVEMDGSVVKELDREMDFGLVEMNANPSKECNLEDEMEETQIGVQNEVFHSSKNLKDDIFLTEHVSSGETQEMELTLNKESSITKETLEVDLEMTEKAADACPKSKIEDYVTGQFPCNSQMPQKYCNVFRKRDRVKDNNCLLKIKCYNAKNVCETSNVIVKEEFHTSTPETNRGRESDKEVGVGCITVTPQSPAFDGCNMTETSQETNILMPIPVPLSSDIFPVDVTCILSEHQPSEKDVNKHICDCVDPQLSPISKSEIDDMCIQLSFTPRVDFYPSDLDKAIFSPNIRLRKRKLCPNIESISKKLETEVSNASNKTKEFGNSEPFASASEISADILVTVPADSDITPDMLEFVSFGDIPVFFECLDGDVPVSTQILPGFELKSAYQECDDSGVILLDKTRTDIQCPRDFTAQIFPSKTGKNIENKKLNCVANGNQNELSSVCKIGAVESTDHIDFNKESDSELALSSNAVSQTTGNLDSSKQSSEIRYFVTQINSTGFQLNQDVQFKNDNNTFDSQCNVNCGVESHRFDNDPLCSSNTIVKLFEADESPCITENFPQSTDGNSHISYCSAASQNESSLSGETRPSFSLLIDQPLKLCGSLVEEDDKELKSFVGAKFTPFSRRKPPLKNGKSEIVPRCVNLLHLVKEELQSTEIPRTPRKPRKPRILSKYIF